MEMIFVGTAGWSIPRAVASDFPGEGTHLSRYARVLPAAEINSSFHRPHARAVYERWAAATPPTFRFAVKLPRAITHDGELRRPRAALEAFFDQANGLGARLGPVLVQLPPSLAFDARIARSFFRTLRGIHPGPVVCEPRHPSWFEARASATLIDFEIARVATDPSRIAAALIPGGWMGPSRNGRPVTVYYRLHGSPRKYWSRYPMERIRRWSRELRTFAADAEVWCIFDNTASGAAAANALEMVTETQWSGV